MRRIVLALAFCTPILVQAQTFTVSWDAPIQVTQDDAYDNNRPRIALNSENNPVVIWGKDNGRILYHSVYSGSSFSEPVSLLDDDFEIFTADWAGPELGSNGDHVAAVFKRYPENEFGVYMVQSADGGQTWSDTVRVDNVPIGDQQTRFPNVVIDDNGNPAVTIMTFEGNYLEPKYEVLTSIDGGASFSELVNSSTELFAGEACDCCTADIIFDGSQLIQLYRNNYDNIREIRASRSMNWGESFPEGFALDLSDTFSNFCFSSGPSGIVSGDELITTYRINTAVGPRASISLFDMGTGLIDLEEQLSPTSVQQVGQTNPKIAGDGTNIGIVWQEETTNDDNVHFVFSHTGATGLVGSAVEVLNLQLPGKQINPDIAYSDGTFHVVWQDKATGLVMYRKGAVVEAVSVSEILPLGNVQIFPNPSSETILWENSMNHPVQYSCYNAFGQIVMSGNGTPGLNSLDIRLLAAGNYSIAFRSQKGEPLGTSQFSKK